MATSSEIVDDWLASQGAALACPELARLLARALSALWDRAHVTLGDVTLDAVFHRVWSTAVREHPVLAPFNRGSAGHLEIPDLVGTRVEDLRPAVRFVLVECLAVIGRLTAEILTPGLQAALSTVRAARAPSGSAAGQRERGGSK
jgi:hypothetical protein